MLNRRPWPVSEIPGERKMRQKYRICQSQKKNTLNIKEFAVLDKDTKNVDSSMLREDHFYLICDQDNDG